MYEKEEHHEYNALDEIRMLEETGNLGAARRKLMDYLKINRRDAEGWFMAARLSTRKDLKIQHLQRTLMIFPKHALARGLLHKLGGEEGNVFRDSKRSIDRGITILMTDGVVALWNNFPRWGQIVIVLVLVYIVFRIVSALVGLLA